MTSAVDVVARLAGLTERDEWTLPELPPPQNPVADGDYWAAREALAEAGLTLPKAILACECEQAVAAAEEIGFPVAFKALGALHKTDAGGVELILGCRRDPRFGPLLLVGLGGVYTEVLGDTLIAFAPVCASEAESLLRALKGAPLLVGFRGKLPLCVEAAARAAALLSAFAAAHPEDEKVEVNPLLVTRDGAMALDARIVLAPAAETAEWLESDP